MTPLSFLLLAQCLPFIFGAYQGKIVGGNVAERGNFPHQVALRYNGKFLCGGSIIHTSLILTAAHCVASLEMPNIFDFAVIAGVHNETAVNGKEQSRFIKYVYVHDDYDNKTLGNDIAIIVLSESLQFNAFVWKIDLPEANEEFDGYATVSGWGATREYHVGYSEVLKKVVLPIVPIHMCRESYRNKGFIINDSVLCMGEFGQDTCKGDSGSAAICERMDSTRVQCGIVSRGRGCGRYQYPGIYTKVSRYVGWIQTLEKAILADEMNEHVVIREIIKGNITSAIDTFTSCNKSRLLRGIIIGSYEVQEGLQNFLDNLEFIKRLPSSDLHEIAFPVLQEVLVRKKDEAIVLKSILIDDALDQYNISENLKTDMHFFAMAQVKSWFTILQEGKNTSVIIEFANRHEKTLSNFLEDIIIGGLTKHSQLSIETIVQNVLNFAIKLPYKAKHEIALPAFWDVLQTDIFLQNANKSITECVGQTDLEKRVKQVMVETWAFTIRNGNNISKIIKFARECSTTFDDIMSDIIEKAYKQGAGIHDVFNSKMEEIAINVLNFILKLPFCFSYKVGLTAVWDKIKEDGIPQNKILFRLSRFNQYCQLDNETTLSKHISESAISLANRWALKIQRGVNISEILDFDKHQHDAFMMFVERIAVDAYSNVTSTKIEEVAINILNFIAQLYWCNSYKSAVNAVGNKIKENGIPQNAILIRLSRINRNCNASNESSFNKEVDENAILFAKNWALKIRNGKNISEILDFAKQHFDAFDSFLERIVVEAFSTSNGINKKEVAIIVLNFIIQLPWCSLYISGLNAVWEVIREHGMPQDKILIRLSRSNRFCEIANETTVAKEIDRNAIIFVNSWASKIRHGENPSEILDFAKRYQYNFGMFIDILIRNAFIYAFDVNQTDTVLNILQFVGKLSLCEQRNVALLTLWESIKQADVPKMAYMSRLAKVARTCMIETDFYKEITKGLIYY